MKLEHGLAAERLVGDGATGVHPSLRKGRGAVSNATGRFETEERVAFDDGWGGLDGVPPPLRTTVALDSSRTVVARNSSPDLGFDRSINPYRGCEHGCVYCFARPTHAYFGLSPGLDFETKLFAKPDAAKLLERYLKRPGYRCEPIAIGTNTDPYQPIEKRYRIMRGVLEVLDAHNHPVTIVTKSALVIRDLDILSRMAKRRLVKVALSITTLDRSLARSMEPRASTPPRRVEAVRALQGAGVPAAVMVAPVIPALNDHEIEAILEAAADAGAREASYILLRLPLEISGLFKEWLEDRVPARAARVMALMRSMHGGSDYDSRWHVRQTGTGAYAKMISRRFRIASRRLGLDERGSDLDTSAFKVPTNTGDQLALF